jgi:hypothetical protein
MQARTRVESFRGEVGDGFLDLEYNSPQNGVHNKKMRYAFFPSTFEEPAVAARKLPKLPKTIQSINKSTKLPKFIVGQVVSATANQITIKKGKAKHTYTIGGGTAIVDARAGPLSAEMLAKRTFTDRDRVMVRKERAGSSIAQRIQILAIAAQRISGTFVSVSDTVIRLNALGGIKAYPIVSGTKFLDKKGRKLKKTDFKEGESVTVTQGGRNSIVSEIRKGSMFDRN